MPDFATRLIAWQKRCGRHDLPWQATRDPYAVWVSEIMLQQTRVAAVIPYYLRFLARFPDIPSLARAQSDDVLALWSGLGYYTRARNLHRAAQIICDKHGGAFPRAHQGILALPGIGRSTAAAICVFSYGERRAILDGNVKRVLARCFAISGHPGGGKTEAALWRKAEELLPQREIETYTQALMDLGAQMCTRNAPACPACPLERDCLARRDDLTRQLPAPAPRKALPQKETVMLVLLHQGEILLEKRPPAGIWGGLWSLPEMAPQQDAPALCADRFGVQAEALEPLPRFMHTFTHFRLGITPLPLRLTGTLRQARQPGCLWLDIEAALGAAIPAPVRRVLHTISRQR